MRSLKIEHVDTIQQLNNHYLSTLVAPMDGMWEGAIIAQATYWEIVDEEQQMGYFCVNAAGYLLRFHLFASYQNRAQEIFRWLLSTHNIQQAFASTIEPFYFSLCLDFQLKMLPDAYFFQDDRSMLSSFALHGNSIRKAKESDLEHVEGFYRANIEGSSAWLHEFLQKRFKREELFVLYDQQILLAVGECISSQQQPPYVDLGMVVAQAYRGKGLGSFMLTQLKEYCYEMGWKPICSCDVSNVASKKAIEKAGFISVHRMMKIVFLDERSR